MSEKINSLIWDIEDVLYEVDSQMMKARQLITTLHMLMSKELQKDSTLTKESK